MFLGFSDVHSSAVGLILNIRTGYILPQYHVVYDKKFKTVASKRAIDLSETWINLWQNSCDFYLDAWDPTVDGPFPELDSDFLPDSEKWGKEEDEKPQTKAHPQVCAQDGHNKGWFDVEEVPPQTPCSPILPEPELSDHEQQQQQVVAKC